MKTNALKVKRAKLWKKVSLSDADIEKLRNMQEEKDIEGIKQFFINDEQYELHSAEFNIIKTDDIILMFCCHARLDKRVIVIVYNGVVYEYLPRHNQRLFLGGVSKAIYTNGMISNITKPVKIQYMSKLGKIEIVKE